MVVLIAQTLHAALRQAGIPIEGVSIGKADDKATWRIDFNEAASEEERATAADIVEKFEVDQEGAAVAYAPREITIDALVTYLAHTAGVKVAEMRARILDAGDEPEHDGLDTPKRGRPKKPAVSQPHRRKV